MNGRNTAAPPVPGAGLLHPVPLVAVAVLLVNDHVLKRALPGVLSGKLSDFAGLAFFPLVLQGACEVVLAALRRPWRPSPRLLLHCTLLTGVVYALVKTWTPALDLWRAALGALQWPVRALAALALGRALPAMRAVAAVRDPTDLVALPALMLAWVAGRRRT